jgi:inosine-uridine nucleoside N-ribohydrolase
LDTDIGEDIDDILVLAFALNSPEFDVLAVTTVDGDTDARSRIARRTVAAFGQPHIPVVAGYYRAMPQPNAPVPPLTSVHQNDVAPTEAHLPPPCRTPADELIAEIVADHPGEVTVCTIGAMTNLGYALLKFPETARNLKGVVTNGGNFDLQGRCTIGWNLRYDPVAAGIVARSGVNWTLLSESTCGSEATGVRIGPGADDVAAIAEAGLETTDIIWTAIQGWRKNKTEARNRPDALPHVSDLNTMAHLLCGFIEIQPAFVEVGVGARGPLPGLKVDPDPEGPHQVGCRITPGRGQPLHDLLMERLLAAPGARAL